MGLNNIMDINITPYKNALRQLFPTAIIIVSFTKRHIAYELKINPSLSEKEHEDAMPKIKALFGNTLLERYTEETGHHFYIHQRYQ